MHFLLQVKCYMHQLLSGLEHCHNNGVLHRDIKCSNLLIDNEGNLKIADFGLASFYDPEQKQPMTSRVVTLCYRPPELLLGATYYGVGVDLWSAGCILAELLAGKPIMPGRTEVSFFFSVMSFCFVDEAIPLPLMLLVGLVWLIASQLIAFLVQHPLCLFFLYTLYLHQIGGTFAAIHRWIILRGITTITEILAHLCEALYTCILPQFKTSPDCFLFSRGLAWRIITFSFLGNCE